MYVKAERWMWRGINKFVLACDASSKKLYTMFFFDAEGRADEILTMKALSLFLNSKAHPINKYLVDKPLNKDGTMVVEFILPLKLLHQLLNSDTFGVAFQYTYEAPVFAGFEGVELKDGRNKLESLISLCR